MNRVFLSFTLTFLSLTAHCQNEQISEIKSLFKETLNNKSSYQYKSVDDFENSTEGGNLKGFYEQNELKLIEAFYYGHMGKAEQQFYVENDEVYFVFIKNFRYNAPPTVSEYDDNKTRLEEDRYYFWNNKMIRWINQNSEHVNVDSDAFQDKEKDMLEWIESTMTKFK